MFLGKLVSQATHKTGWISHFLFPCEHHRHLLEHRDTTLKECARLRVWMWGSRRLQAQHSFDHSYCSVHQVFTRNMKKAFGNLNSLSLQKTHPPTSARHERKHIPNYGPKIPIAHWDLILVCTHFPPSLRKSWLYILACSKASDPTAHSNSEFPPQWPSGNSCWRSVSSPSLGQEGGMHNVHSSMTTIWKSSIEKHGKLTILEMHVCLEPDIRSPLLWLWMYNDMFLWCAVCWHIDKYHC